MLRNLFEEVRVKGRIDLKEGPLIRDVLPFVYSGESDSEDSTPYYNSGGRSILFQKGGVIYRVKGVDPFGYLTERVANSRKNRIGDVGAAKRALEAQLSKGVEREDLGFGGRPFGTFHFEQAECEIEALKRLEAAYEQLGIENPCQPLFYEETGIEKQGEKTYQTVFRLPSLGADLRTREYIELLIERLDQCSPSEIAEKSKNINRLFGRFIYWAGVNTGIFASFGLSPLDSSFCPQNWTINRYRDGYGIFRVDHTSTKITDPTSSFNALTREEKGLSFILNNFSVFPSRVQVASDPDSFLLDGQRELKFSQILNLKKGAPIDESSIIDAHRNVFGMGIASFVQGDIAPIPEEMFLEALA